MSEENVEIVQSMLGPFGGVDVSAVDWDAEVIREILEQSYSPDVVLRALASGAGSGPSAVYRGWDGLVQYLKEWLEPFSEYHLEPLDYVEAGDCVLVPSRQWGVGSSSGARVEIELTLVYELRDGKIVRLDQYDTVEDAREAVELR